MLKVREMIEWEPSKENGIEWERAHPRCGGCTALNKNTFPYYQEITQTLVEEKPLPCRDVEHPIETTQKQKAAKFNLTGCGGEYWTLSSFAVQSKGWVLP